MGFTFKAYFHPIGHVYLSTCLTIKQSVTLSTTCSSVHLFICSSVHLFICYLFISLSVLRRIRMSLFLCQWVYKSVNVFLYLCDSLSECLSIRLSLHLSVYFSICSSVNLCLCVWMPLCLCLWVLVCAGARLSICLSSDLCPSVWLSVRPSFCPSPCMSLHLPVRSLNAPMVLDQTGSYKVTRMKILLNI
jgi:hypothetical protein